MEHGFYRCLLMFLPILTIQHHINTLKFIIILSVTLGIIGYSTEIGNRGIIITKHVCYNNNLIYTLYCDQKVNIISLIYIYILVAQF